MGKISVLLTGALCIELVIENLQISILNTSEI